MACATRLKNNDRKETYMLAKLRNKKGFTLIELLIVVAIIGILAAIAIPQFAAYRIRGYNAAANSDLKNLKTALEGTFADNQTYP
jgi:type IV pilus assembly protein PilA